MLWQGEGEHLVYCIWVRSTTLGEQQPDGTIPGSRDPRRGQGRETTRLLLWEGTIRVGGCRSSRSRSEAVIVAMGDVLPQYPLLCC
ncbi:unnamed protein product, partial [Laminaria digitata]